MIHMKNQALFSSKDKSKKLKSRLLQVLFGALRIKEYGSCTMVPINFSILFLINAEGQSKAQSQQIAFLGYNLGNK